MGGQDQMSRGPADPGASLANPGPVMLSASGLPASVEVRNFRIISERVSGGGAPTPEQVAAMPQRGYVGIINLKTHAEAGNQAEEAAAAAAGLAYVQIPVSGGSLDLLDAVALHHALAQMPAEGHILVHCRSGNRVGALWGLSQAWDQGLTPAEAVLLGQRSGMRSEMLAHKVDEALTPPPVRGW